MSADFDFTMTTPALLKASELYHACPTFHTERDGSRHRCSECNQPEVAHVIVALRTALQSLAPTRDRLVTELAETRHALAEAAIPIEVLAHDGGRSLAPEVLASVRALVPLIRDVLFSEPGDGENDYDETHRRRPKLTSAERQQGVVDEGHEDWLRDERDER